MIEEPDKLLPAHLFLEKLGIPYQPLTFPVSTEGGAANVAEALGYNARQMVKTLIFESDRKECVLVMVGGDQSSISGHLKKAIGSRNVKLASLETVKEITGYEVGSVPPFHWQPQGFRSFLDLSLLDEDVLGVGAGQWGCEIMIAPADLIEASKAAVVNLTNRSLPVLVEG